ncbi:hypothetical protein [Nonomuraea maritima]|uniref:hypothetical protein n=1 Tax=Nonomuraea maritima TaxID=683260 RepID=UPI00371CE4D9
MSPLARTLQVLLMVSGFAVLGYAVLWHMDDATGWQCRAEKVGKETVQICDTEDGVDTPILLGMGGLALEIASVSVAAGARRRDPHRPSPPTTPAPVPPTPFAAGQPPQAPAAQPGPWPPQPHPGQR